MATVSPSWAYTLQLPHDPRAPGVARATLRALLAAHGLAEVVPVAELLAGELLANAHRHTRGPYALRVRPTEAGRLRVGVWDSDPRVPYGFAGERAYGPGVDAESGRGLHILRACADEVGVSVLRDHAASGGGKLLWAECQAGREGCCGRE